ncbi:MAG: 4-(cytidine 5'-diphospho)-2-C-methyl-D-erythritol kinase [Bacteroides sp.]|nr:4-(cytidine 5'-diphospho)-2-C-methyl-D-erythritol kinase [Eubacterium sp.]MCM1417684.1 4-(cytidine 5'-diphospho)-2-C-methyl-D-erythritol kinase [Roseburia sp.]MCM1461850.1 4-(cytidine 5'-diphospho)-2-C-methyl-D-erythritol kinase [Bacteroides sp.]
MNEIKRTVERAYAKINLYLDITGRLANGYHTLDTVMCAIDLYDEVVVSIGSEHGVYLSGDPTIPTDERNIAMKAANTFFAETGLSAKVSIRIIKNIPTEAGLGGSSTDGATVLKALNRLFGEPLPRERLIELGASLGADVPFCLVGGAAVCGGIGERITPIELPNDFVIGLVKPDLSCSTAAAYRAYDDAPLAARADFDGFVRSLPLGVKAWSGGVYNVFEKLYRDERIDALVAALKKNGALAAALSGSGSAVFGIFESETAARNALLPITAPFRGVVKIANREEI